LKGFLSILNRLLNAEEEMSIRKGEILAECDHNRENEAISKFETDRDLKSGVFSVVQRLLAASSVLPHLFWSR
jgi:hypothetical protein